MLDMSFSAEKKKRKKYDAKEAERIRLKEAKFHDWYEESRGNIQYWNGIDPDVKLQILDGRLNNFIDVATILEVSPFVYYCGC